VTVQNVYDAIPLIAKNIENFYLRFYLDEQLTGVYVIN